MILRLNHILREAMYIPSTDLIPTSHTQFAGFASAVCGSVFWYT